jgi:hypothetical protein
MDLLDIGLYAFYVFLAVAVIAAIVFPIINAIKTPAALLRSLVGVGALLVLFGISYALSSGDVGAGSTVTSGESKLIGAGLIMFYISLLLAILAVVYSEVTKAFK